MKYIRTSNMLHEIYEEDKEHYIVCGGCFSKNRNDIKVADTIKELVDGYYLDIDNQPFDSTQVYDKNELERALNEKADWQSYSDRKYLEYEINLYAFIKTDTGLCYVAKMNEKELELVNEVLK